jgi:hypothetical protein
VSRLAEYSHPPRIRRLLRSLVPIVCPPEVERLGVVDAVVDHVALSMRAFPAPLRRALLLGLTTYDLSAAGWPRARGKTASKLPRHRAAAWYAFWWRSPLLPQRELAKAVKALMAIAYYEQPAVQTELGYAPQAWIDKVKGRRLEVYGEAIRKHDRALIEPDPLPSSLAARRAATREAG